ncbi:MAG: biopolymer transporter ExbD [Planctomycetota bacterium]
MSVKPGSVRLARRSPDVRVELTPLIDVVFLLLTFFVFSIVLMVRVDALDVTLPELTGAADAPRGRLVTVAVTSEGDIRVDGEPTTLETLAADTQAAIDAATTGPAAGASGTSSGNAPRLVLAIDTDAPAGVLIAVGGELARNGLGGFSLVGTPAGAGAGGSPTPRGNVPNNPGP